MDDKVLNLVEIMCADLKHDIKTVGNHVSKLDLSIENEIKPNIKALLDGYKQIAEGQEEIKGRLENIEKHMVHQDNEITFLKKVK